MLWKQRVRRRLSYSMDFIADESRDRSRAIWATILPMQLLFDCVLSPHFRSIGRVVARLVTINLFTTVPHHFRVHFHRNTILQLAM